MTGSHPSSSLVKKTNPVPFSVLDQTHSWAIQQSVKCQAFPEINSTNDFAKSMTFETNLMTQLIIAGFQTEGRGRGDHHWSSNKNLNLLSSWCLQFPSSVQIHPTFSCKVGLALYTSLKSTWPWISFNLKAPNDIYINDKKLAGLLIEFVQDSNLKLIMGLGLNVFDSPLSNLSVSLSEVLEPSELNSMSWNCFLSQWYFQWNQLFSKADSTYSNPLNTFQKTCLLKALNEHPLLKEKYISVENDGSLMTTQGLIHWSNL
jgi:BirA family biotin operon repressor/biotin-[acetyl-CoA-carboxylase] ligase